MSKALSRLIDYILDENEGMRRLVADLHQQNASQADEIKRLTAILSVYELADSQEVAPAQHERVTAEAIAAYRAMDAEFRPEPDKVEFEDFDQEEERLQNELPPTFNSVHPEVTAVQAAHFLRTAGPIDCPFCNKLSEQKRGRHQHMKGSHPDELAIYERDKDKIVEGRHG